jgi:hypothetical protein
MTQYYTHVGETAAGAAVAALPDITGRTPTPPARPKSGRVKVLKAKVRELAEKLTPDNLATIREQLLALCV